MSSRHVSSCPAEDKTNWHCWLQASHTPKPQTGITAPTAPGLDEQLAVVDAVVRQLVVRWRLDGQRKGRAHSGAWPHPRLAHQLLRHHT